MQLAPAPAPAGQQEFFHDSSTFKKTTFPFSRGGRNSQAREALSFGVVECPCCRKTHVFYVHHPFVGSLRSHPHWHWIFPLCPDSCSREGAVFWSRGEAAAPRPRASPGLFLEQRRLAAADYYARKQPEVSRRWNTSNITVSPSLTPIIYFFRNCRLLQFYISQVTCKIYIHKTLPGGGFLQGHGSLASLSSTTPTICAGTRRGAGTAAPQPAGRSGQGLLLSSSPAPSGFKAAKPQNTPQKTPQNQAAALGAGRAQSPAQG